MNRACVCLHVYECGVSRCACVDKSGKLGNQPRFNGC